MARGDGRVFLRNKTYWLAYFGPKPDGTYGEIRESSKSEDEEQARELLKRRLREVQNHREGLKRFQGPRQERIKVGELLDALKADYEQRAIKSLRHTLGHMEHVREHFGAMRAVALTTQKVRSYIDLRLGEKKANATVNRELEVLGRAFRLAIQDGRLAYSPRIPALPENNARQGFFEREEFEAIEKHLPDDLKDFARFAFLTGWRRGEVAGLTWEAVDREAGELRLADSKNGEGRVLPMDEELVALIERRWEAREYPGRAGETVISPLVFHRLGVPRTNYNKRWRKACTDAGYPDKILHDARRTVVRDLTRSGVPTAIAMGVTGHKTESVFRRYNIVTKDDKLDALRRRSEYLKARAEKPKVVKMRAANTDKNADT